MWRRQGGTNVLKPPFPIFTIPNPPTTTALNNPHHSPFTTHPKTIKTPLAPLPTPYPTICICQCMYIQLPPLSYPPSPPKERAKTIYAPPTPLLAKQRYTTGASRRRLGIQSPHALQLPVLASRALVSVDEAFVLRRSCGSGDQPVVFERAVEGFGGGSGGLWVLGLGWCWSGDGSLEIW